MNIHIMTEGKFVEKFADFLNEFYPADSNYIYVYENVIDCERRTNIEHRNVRYVRNLFDEVDLSLAEYGGKIFFHGFFLEHFVDYGIYVSKRYLAEKIVLIIYGADLYNNRYLLQRSFFHPGLWHQEMKKKRLIKRVGNFMTFASSDFALIKKWYGASGKSFDCLYPSNANISLLQEIRGTNCNHDKIVVLLGNSATPTNNHIDALDILSQYKDENIEIVCPLSYGDVIYGKKVIGYARGIFGNKFLPILDYLDIDAYTKLLNRVDVAMYYNNRQQATGNIEILGYLGKKIYIRSDTTTWQHYVERDKCRFFDSFDIKDAPFSKFCEITSDDRQFNLYYFEKIWDNDYIKKLWDNVIEA